MQEEPASSRAEGAAPLSDEQAAEQALVAKYGGLKPKLSPHSLLKKGARTYFDSAEFELQKRKLPTDRPRGVPVESLPARLAPTTPQGEGRVYRKSNLDD